MEPKRERPRATYADVLAAPDGRVAEVVDGELYSSPRPALRHTRASSALGAELTLPFGRGRGGPGGWVLLDEPEVHLGEDIVVPDLAGWRRTRLPELPDSAFLTLAPDWVCEVLSPGTRAFDRTRKLPVYAGARVQWAWLVDPAEKSLEVLHLEAGLWTLDGAWEGDVRVRAQPFDAIELELAVLWAR